jgi:hypothetical protein
MATSTTSSRCSTTGFWDVATRHDLMITEPEFAATTLETVAADPV